MFGATKDVTQALIGVIDLEGIDPYENWEKATRPSGAASEPLWQPVYVEILPDPNGEFLIAAQTLLSQIATSREIAVESPTRAMLQALAAGGALREMDKRFFIYRPEAVSSKASLAGGSAMPVKLLHVGPAMPTVFETELPPVPAIDPEIGQGVAGTVITGVIDDVMGFANERFRTASHGSRVERFWMQGMPSITGGRASIGGEIDRAGIELLLSQASGEASFYDRLFPKGVYVIRRAPRGELGLTPYESLNSRPFAFAETHGTQVLDLAAGWPMDQAPEGRPIMAVQLPQLATLETWGARLDLFILLGLQRLFYWADRWQEGGQTKRAPLVVNLSYGVLAGPKDGSGMIEAEIARLVAARNAEGVPTAVILPAGNGHRDNCHAECNLLPSATMDLTVRLQPDDQSVTFVEIWLHGLDRVRLAITPPQGTKFDRLIQPADTVFDWQGNLGGGLTLTLARIYVRPYPPVSGASQGRTRITIAFLPTQNHEVPHQVVPAGAYGLHLTNEGAGSLNAQIECQRDETPPDFPIWGRQAYLDHAKAHGWDDETADYSAPEPGSPVTRKGTLSGYATAAVPGVVVVSSAIDRDALARAALYSASGPNRGRARPDLSAISEESRAHPGVMAAATLSGGVRAFSGTSNAAPQVARALVAALSANPALPVGVAVQALATVPVAAIDAERLGTGTLPFRNQEGRQARRIRP